MWFESQNCAMMGLQTTSSAIVAGKRKLESSAQTDVEASPAKNGKWEPPASKPIPSSPAIAPTGAVTITTTNNNNSEDCIARLRAVAVPTPDAWRAPTPSLAASLLSEDEFDDDEFEDELSDDEKCATAVAPSFEPPRFAQTTTSGTITSALSQQAAYPNNRYQSSSTDYWQYYQPPQQQTIRCEENGKSYLELGASPQLKSRMRCCDGRTRWCHVPCYRQRRLAVLNLSMCKLARYRQCSDPSLRRSVLICNTLRRLEREMEADPPEPSYPMLPEMTPPTRPCPVTEPTTTSTTTTTTTSSSSSTSSTTNNGYEQNLRDMACSSGRATPFPATSSQDTDSGLGDDEMTRPINWGSVLSLTTQTDLESLNNNDLYAELGLTNHDLEWKMEPTSSSSRTESDWDGFVQVLVGGT